MWALQGKDVILNGTRPLCSPSLTSQQSYSSSFWTVMVARMTTLLVKQGKYLHLDSVNSDNPARKYWVWCWFCSILMSVLCSMEDALGSILTFAFCNFYFNCAPFLQDSSGSSFYRRKHSSSRLQCCERWRIPWRNQSWSHIHSRGNCLA